MHANSHLPGCLLTMLKQSQIPQAKQIERGKHFSPGHHPREDTHNNFQAPQQTFFLVFSTKKIKEEEF